MWRLNFLFAPRARVLLVIAVTGVLAAAYLELRPGALIPSAAGWQKAAEFFRAAGSPAVRYEDPPPPGTVPLLWKVAAAAWQTVAFAVVSVGLALVAGFVLAFFASSAWWEDDPAGASHPVVRVARRVAAPALVWTTRGVIALARSIHELLWAVLFLSAMGLNTLTAILAIAIPYAGVFAKIFAEILDETDRNSAYALRALGGSPAQVFLYGLLPRALPDMTAYACYRLECGMRSSAVMGFFGIPTIGYYLHPAFDEQHYHEVWTYLYVLIGLIVLVDTWSSAIRRRLV